jgi:hypothetical protein
VTRVRAERAVVPRREQRDELRAPRVVHRDLRAWNEISATTSVSVLSPLSA